MESIFQHIGSCGCFQCSHVICHQFIRTTMVCALNLMVFGNYEPPWQCVTFEKLPNSSSSVNWTSSHLNHVTEELDYDGASIDYLPMAISSPSLNSTQDNRTAFVYRGTCDLLPVCDAIVFDSISVTVVSEFELICDRAYIPSIIISVQFFGSVVGSILGGQLGESFGRKTSVVISLSVMSVATFAAYWSTVWQFYAGLMFAIGIGVGGISSCETLQALEFLTPKWRGRYVGIPIWTVGLLVFAFVMSGLKDWRKINLFVGSISATALVCALWLPESLRWLYVHGKEEETEEVLRKIMRLNRRKENVSELALKLKEAIDEKDGPGSSRYTYKDLFSIPKYRALTIRVGVIWFSLVMCYFTMNFSAKALSGDFYTNLMLVCGTDIPFVLLLWPCLNTFGRKRAFVGFICVCTSCLLACVIVYYVTTPEVSGPATKYLALVAKGCALISWMTMSVYLIELFPTTLRSLASGFAFTAGRAGGIVGSMIIPRDPESMATCFIVLSGCMLIASLLVLPLSETMDKPLEDVASQKDNRRRQISGENTSEI